MIEGGQFEHSTISRGLPSIDNDTDQMKTISSLVKGAVQDLKQSKDQEEDIIQRKKNKEDLSNSSINNRFGENSSYGDMIIDSDEEVDFPKMDQISTPK